MMNPSVLFMAPFYHKPGDLTGMIGNLWQEIRIWRVPGEGGWKNEESMIEVLVLTRSLPGYTARFPAPFSGNNRKASAWSAVNRG